LHWKVAGEIEGEREMVLILGIMALSNRNISIKKIVFWYLLIFSTILCSSNLEARITRNSPKQTLRKKRIARKKKAPIKRSTRRRKQPIQTINRKRFSALASKILTKNDHLSPSNNIVWQHKPEKPFTELIVSWNAKRPHSGKITFYVSVKHTKWSSWQRIAEWTKTGQRTFVNKLDPLVHTKHVRVEMQRGRLGREFRIKAICSGGAHKESLKALFGCSSNHNHFVKDSPYFTKPSTAIRGVPRQSQMVLNHPRKYDLCSPTSLSMILHYFKGLASKKTHQLPLHQYASNFADKVHDNGYLDIYGNWLLNVAQAYDSCCGDIFYCVKRLNGINELYGYLKRKIPVAVSVRRLKGGATPYANGHFLVVIGWNKKTKSIICVDPAFSTNKATLKTYNISDFIKAWGMSRNLSYVPLVRRILT